MCASSALRSSALLVAAALTAAGVGFSIAAFVSPAWQVVHMTELHTEHEHGLWEDCAHYYAAEGHDFVFDVPQERHCTFKFDYGGGQKAAVDEEDGAAADESKHHQFQKWQVAVMILIGVAVLCGVCAIIDALCTFRFRQCSLAFCALSFAAVLSTAGALLVFFIASHQVDNRYLKALVAIYEQKIGHAFYFECISLALHFAALLVGSAATYLFMFRRQVRRSGDNRAPQGGAPLLNDYRGRDMIRVRNEQDKESIS